MYVSKTVMTYEPIYRNISTYCTKVPYASIERIDADSRDQLGLKTHVYTQMELKKNQVL